MAVGMVPLSWLNCRYSALHEQDSASRAEYPQNTGLTQRRQARLVMKTRHSRGCVRVWVRFCDCIAANRCLRDCQHDCAS